MNTLNQEFKSTPRRITTRPAAFSGLGLISGIIIGSVVMYLLDPRQGTRRRALFRDKARSLASRSSHQTGKLFRHLNNKFAGLVANLSGTIKPQGETSDRKLADRVRATIGRSIPHPGHVDIAVHSGIVTMRGDLKPHEAGQLVLAIRKVPGVVGVDNQIIDTSLPQ
jgi:hypothetical protein